MVRASTTGDPLDQRRTSSTYDASGNQDTRTVEGVESGSAFLYVTETSFNSEGQPTVVDPRGYGTADQTTYTYDPARGNLLPATRTDPLIGTTTFGYDPFNRRNSVTDPNGVTTDTVYDDLDRVRFLIQRGAIPEEDLVTEYVYNAFGDLFQSILPEGNVIEYGYDHAGRLIRIEQKPDADPASHGERTVYMLDAYGHHVHEYQQRWDGAEWFIDGWTRYQYSTRCQLDWVIVGMGSGQESITEYAYDCAGNLEQIWCNSPRYFGRSGVICPE